MQLLLGTLTTPQVCQTELFYRNFEKFLVKYELRFSKDFVYFTHLRFLFSSLNVSKVWLLVPSVQLVCIVPKDDGT